MGVWHKCILPSQHTPGTLFTSAIIVATALELVTESREAKRLPEPADQLYGAIVQLGGLVIVLDTCMYGDWVDVL